VFPRRINEMAEAGLFFTARAEGSLRSDEYRLLSLTSSDERIAASLAENMPDNAKQTKANK